MEKEKKQLPQRSLEFELLDRKYSINFPNTGQLMDIAILRARLSIGNYETISNSYILGDKLAQFSIDTISTLTILCPSLLKELNVKNYTDLELIDMKKLIKVYIDKILPWMNDWYEVLNKIEDEE